MSNVKPGLVSVILVNYRGVDDTIAAIGHIRGLNWPSESIEIIVVDNASGDDSVARLREEAEGVAVIASAENLGFAGGCNLGVAHSAGELVAFLNNDARPDTNWISTVTDHFATSSRVGAVASQVLDWEGERIDYVGAAMTWFGMGYKPHVGEPRSADTNRQDVLFGTGSAMFVRRTAFEELNGFDERFFMFFEDVDFGWRLNLAGWRFVYEPSSIAYHKHHASMGEFGSYQEQYLLERNALFAMYKNLDEDNLGRLLPAAMALSVRRGVAKGAVDSTGLDLRARDTSSGADMQISKQAVASLFAIDQFVEELDSLSDSRRRIQSSRRILDSKVMALFGNRDQPSFGDAGYLRGYEALTTAFDTLSSPRALRVVVVTGDPIGVKLAGPAIRAWKMAELIGRRHEVRLVTLSGAEAVTAPFEIAHVPPGADRAFRRFEQWADVIVFQGHAMAVFTSLHRSSKIIVVDIYDPMHLEQLEQSRGLPAGLWEKQVKDATEVMNEQLVRGDFFLCASERQRHFYLGQLAALGRVSPSTYRSDPDLSGLLAIAPFGMEAGPPVHARAVLKGVVPGIAETDQVLLWSGGLYNWFDPATLIEAVALLHETRPAVRLFFQGTRHPNPAVPEMTVVQESREHARRLGALGRSVFFNDSWVDFADRQNYLTEADAGVSTHFAHLETTYSFRTRILDYLWAELPMVVTEGDYFADLVEGEKLGVVVRAQDVGALASALERVLYDADFNEEAKANIRRVRERFTWESTLAPLLDFLDDPHRAADHTAIGRNGPVAAAGTRRRRRSGFAHDVRQSLHYLRNGGPVLVMEKVKNRLRRR